MVNNTKEMHMVELKRIFSDGRSILIQDTVIVEEVIEIYVNNDLHARLSRTPGNDSELAIGFLFTAGIIRSIDDVEEFEFIAGEKGQCDKFKVEVAEGEAGMEAKIKKEHEEDLPQPDSVFKMLRSLLEGQRLHVHTGAAHSATLCEMNGEGIRTMEDVGRLNTIDKIAGFMLMNGIPADDKALMVSGRASCEMIAKAARLGVRVFASKAAPTSGGLRLAREKGIPVLAFLNDDKFNLYR